MNTNNNNNLLYNFFILTIQFSPLQLLVNDTDDSLDNCIWLTGDQLDEIFDTMEDDLNGQYPEHSGGYMDDRNNIQHRRQKRKVTNFKKFSFSMWPKKMVHWKFNGAHSKFMVNGVIAVDI
jgi:hypothetical protein